ncbi:MAG TPA: Mrp/NBP35 family ATP-binding protein [Longimicrobiales bacterium]|nr:Mrp/NBP35 family ATP-binding protein [Longimicrobiales bacterium]
MAGNDDVLERVRETLAGVTNERTGQAVLAEQVQDLSVENGVVSFGFALGPQDPGTLVRETRSAVEAVDGVDRVKIDVRLPQTMQAQQQAAGQARQAPQRRPAPGSIPAPTPDGSILPNIAHFVAVSSGKGGVGKSTVASNLAVSLAAQGRRVGLLDADIYGPNIPVMFGEKRRPKVTGPKGQERIVPLEAHGVKLMSLGFLLEEEQPAIMRGPLVSGVLRQFLEQVEWGELDVMIIDLPPGTGDAQLSLVQTIDLDGAVMVTTPQAVSTADVRRGVRMFERVETDILGIIENMSGFVCPGCGERHDIFGVGGGRELAEKMGLPYLGDVPLDTAVRAAGDMGQPTAAASPESPAGEAFNRIAAKILAAVEDPVQV